MESAASGFLVGVETARRLTGRPPVDFPRETAIGALGPVTYTHLDVYKRQGIERIPVSGQHLERMDARGAE